MRWWWRGGVGRWGRGDDFLLGGLGCGAPMLLLAGMVFVLCCGRLVGAVGAVADSCPNAALRTGPSAGLPDCRAYELVTPANKGRTQALTFTGDDTAIVSGDGEALALSTLVPLGPNPSVLGARSVFSRGTAGWEMHSAVASGASEDRIEMRLFSPDLSQVVLLSETALNISEHSEYVVFEAGPVGGPYEKVASIPRPEAEGGGTQFLGASANLGQVLFSSVDHELPLPGVEAAAAKTTDSGAMDLYDWSDGHLQLVNIRKDGSLLSQCGATLGAGGGHEAKSTAVHAVSEDGSKVFFTSPSGPGCGASALFMRVGGGEPVEVSAPEPGVKLEPSEIGSVLYNYATPDGSKVFFNTRTPLTAGETAEQRGQNKLFEYDTEAPEGERLKLVTSGQPTTNGVPETYGVGLEFLKGFYFDENGSVVYVESRAGEELQEVARYETSIGKRTFVALAYHQKGTFEPSYVTPNGEFFMFTSKSVIEPVEPRGAGPQNEGKGPDEMYLYDNASGRVTCVTCGAGDVPPEGEAIQTGSKTVLKTNDEVPAMVQMSDDGREVFFQTTARLVPQDTNSTLTKEGSGSQDPGLDVYEWEAEGSEEAPGVFCGVVVGCTHLISSGEDVGPARLLGASADGSNVFFESASQLVPQDMDEFPDIYDARVDGGFAVSLPPPPCLSCQGVGSPPPLFSVPATEAFVGAGNLASLVEEKPKKPQEPKKKPSGKPKKRKLAKAKGGSRQKKDGRAGGGGKVFGAGVGRGVLVGVRGGV
jgi:hypothetical protein